MGLPVTIKDLSTTAINNSPAGSDAIGNPGQIDDYFRAYGAVQRAESLNKSWERWNDTPTYISATSFSVATDLTARYLVGRRIKSTNTGGTIYSVITASVFSSVTTVTVVNDSGVLDSGLSEVQLGVEQKAVGPIKIISGRSFFSANNETFAIGFGYNQTIAGYIGGASNLADIVLSNAGGGELARLTNSGNLLIGTPTDDTIHKSQINGALRASSVHQSVVTKTANYTVLVTDSIILCDLTSASFTVTLPSAAAAGAGFSPTKKIRSIVSNANSVTVAVPSGQYINGALNGTITVTGVSGVELASDGVSKWYSIAAYF